MRNKSIIIKTVRISALAAAAIFVISACTREEFDTNVVEEGKPVEATMTFSTNDIAETIVTKSNSYSQLTSLLLFIFNSDGSKCEQIVETGDGSLDLSGSTVVSQGIQYTAKFGTTTGTKRICALGNYISDNNWEHYDMTGVGGDDFDPDDQNRWGDFSKYVDELRREALDEGMSSAELGRSLFFLERGFSEYGNTPTFDDQQMIMTGADVITIDENGNVTGSSNPDGNRNLYLERCIADIQFNIQQEYKKSNGNTITFNASNYYVYNIPGGTRLAPGRGIEENANESYREFYFDGTRKPINPVEGGVYSFQFFIPENIQETLGKGTNDYGEKYDFNIPDNSGYQYREKWDPVGTDEKKPTHKRWKNAPLNATYVVIEGQYSEMDPNNNLVYAGSVSYTIHLGNFGPGKWGDFSVERNHRYIYSVKVQGVDNIAVEAESDEEKQPGAEGSIVSTSGTTRNYALDAHFEQVLLEYNLSDIADAAEATLNSNTGMPVGEAISEHLIVTIETPFQNGIKELRPYMTFKKYYNGTTSYQDALQKAREEDITGLDYKWVEFWPQTTDETDLESYPGLPAWKSSDGSDSQSDSKYLLDVYDACVKMGQVVEKIMRGEKITYYDEGWFGNISGIRAESTGDDGRGITVFYSGGKYYARFTGFVDEYYYTSDPVTGSNISWGAFANVPQRRMLISMDVQTSADGNSSLSNVHTNISQRSVQTFYNANLTGLNAFGLETFNETPLCLYGNQSSSADSDTDGRSNQISLIRNSSSWDNYINASENGHKNNVTGRRKLTAAYRENQNNIAYYACMSRNRDLDGDGRIDNDEVRWYLPALNEYLRIGMGAISMSNESNLYIGDKSEMNRNRKYPDDYAADGALYYTSTYGSEVYWAVEKGASGGLGSSYDSNTALPLRCIRSLSANLDKQIPADALCEVKLIESGNYLLDFRGRLDNNMYRPTPTATQLNNHDEDELQNRFYDGLVVSMEEHKSNVPLSEILNVDNQSNPCSDYYEGSRNDPRNGVGKWRVPNLAELTVMSSDPDRFFNGATSDTYASTSFSNDQIRLAFRYTLKGKMITCYGDWSSGQTLEKGKGAVRCVRDATDQDFAEAQTVN